jgi:transposase
MSVHEISALVELPRSTVSAVIVKWKCPGATTAQPRSGRAHNLTGPQSAEARENGLFSVATLDTEFQTAIHFSPMVDF